MFQCYPGDMRQITRDEIISHTEMCMIERKAGLQQGINYRLNPAYTVILMSQRSNAPYRDHIHPDGVTLEYEGHNITRENTERPDPTLFDQPRFLPSGRPTQNGLLIQAIEECRAGKREPELVKAYEKIHANVWSLKGLFRLMDYKIVNDGTRNVYRFILQLDPDQDLNLEQENAELKMTRIIPSDVKRAVWKRDGGKCVLCGATKNLHWDHELPYSKGGTSLSANNIRILCMKHNLSKSAKIE